jgi:alkyl hydroperoxide reductase subunit AhpC
MAQLEPFKDRIQRAGATLVYIAAQKRDSWLKPPAKYLAKNPVSFPYLLDEDRSVTKAYGVYHRLGRDAFNIAHPATLVVDSNGIVRFIYRSDNQTDFAPVERVLDAVQLAGPGKV